MGYADDLPESPNGPDPTGTGGYPTVHDSFYDQVQGAYQRWLGRSATDAEVEGHRGNPGGIQAVLTLIQQSPEAGSYEKQQRLNQQPTNPTDPTTTNPTNPGGPTTPSGYNYDQFVQKARDYYQQKYGTTLSDATIGQIKSELGSSPDPNYRYQDADFSKVQSWIDAHAPGGGATDPNTGILPGGREPTPPTDPNGGLLPGGHEPVPTAPTTGIVPGGLESTPTAPTTNPTPTAPGTTQGPAPSLPAYQAPASFKTSPAFSYADFQAPSAADVLNDPGYQFTLQQGVDALSRSRAAMGTLNTGGTLKDIVDYGQNLASTRYNDVYGRDLNTYQANRNNAISAYDTNYNTQYKDPYQINYQSQYVDPFQFDTTTALANYNAQQHNYDQNLGYGLNYAQLGQNQNQFSANLGLSYAGLNQTNAQFNAGLAQNQNQFTANLGNNRYQFDATQNQHTIDQNQYYQQHNVDQNQYYGYQNKVFDYNQNRNNLLDSFDMKYKLLGLL